MDNKPKVFQVGLDEDEIKFLTMVIAEYYERIAVEQSDLTQQISYLQSMQSPIFIQKIQALAQTIEIKSSIIKDVMALWTKLDKLVNDAELVEERKQADAHYGGVESDVDSGQNL